MNRILEINHRALLMSASKKRNFGFMRLPDDLQDAIITGMDRGTLTLRGAEQLALQNGFRLSYEAISTYYRAVRKWRAELLRQAV